MSIAFVGHIGYDNYELADGILKYIPIFKEAARQTGYTPRIYITVVTDYMYNYVKLKFSEAVIIMVPNFGADFLPFIRVLQTIPDHKYVFKIHTKTTAGWRETITRPLISSVDRAVLIIRLMDANINSSSQYHHPEIGAVISKDMGLPAEAYCTRSQLLNLLLEQKWANSKEEADRLINNSKFSGGVIYWARVDTLIKAFGNLDIEAETKLNMKAYQTSGGECRLHHWERMEGIAITRFDQIVLCMP